MNAPAQEKAVGLNERLLITGATGFIGSELTRRALDRGYRVRVLSRRPLGRSEQAWGKDVEIFHADHIAREEGLPRLLEGLSAVVHLAGRAHVGDEGDPLNAGQYFETNTVGTVRLALAAARAGVTKFVFVSSVKVNGRLTAPGQAFSEEDGVCPSGAYALSKWEAERRLWRLSAASGLEVVVVRPPLVYGPGVKANMLALVKLVETGIPMPLASIRNTRSYLGVANLADLLLTCLEHPRAAGQTFLASDGSEFSTPDLVRAISTALHRPSRLLPCPLSLLRVASWAKTGVGAALLDSLLVDGSKIREVLGWSPPVTAAVGVQEMAAWYLEARKGVV